MQQQHENEWCWAAVAVSVDHYFNPNATSTQEALAAELTAGDTECSTKPDCPEALQTALENLGHLNGQPETDSLSFDEVQTAIGNSLPLCIRIEWFGKGAHFVAIDGVGSTPGGDDLVHVKDPFFGDSSMIFNDFYENYLGAGAWSATFQVQE
jgi:Papain-like cysteine protease AvrRpt2